ncbi:MAG TPA: DNA repair exonuclease [Atribacterota bacterium]|nr:DNA repair exonuclease [Atribacterota bacterium]
MGIKIFHTADLHLGMRFAGYPDVQDELINARYETLEKLVSLANREDCTLFVMAGDLFDRTTLNVKDISRAARALNEFNGELIIILPGNHDYYTEDSNLWNEFSKYAGDRVLILKNPDIYDLNKYHLKIKIYAAPCSAKHSSENLIKWVNSQKSSEDDSIKIGLAHGSLEGVSPDFDKTYYPMTRKELGSSGIDLWLIGHTHLPWPENPEKNSRILIPGTPEPDGFDCNHKGSAFIIDLKSSSDMKIQKVSTGKYCFSINQVLPNEDNDITSMKRKYTGAEFSNVVLRLILKGRLRKEELDRVDEALDLINDNVLLLQTVKDELHESITSDLIDSKFTENSFPHQLLSSLLEEKEEISFKSLQKAYDIIREVRNET